ncbi:MAG TPA: GNAT family N-acetyltransferase [Polyangia bacterium]|nr:GNAT family N-acetyltransferase [Polyangia bacterium]
MARSRAVRARSSSARSTRASRRARVVGPGGRSSSDGMSWSLTSIRSVGDCRRRGSGVGGAYFPTPAEKTMNNLTIRTASADDVDLLADIFVRCFTGPPWNEPWSAATAARRFSLLTSAPAFRGMIAMEGDRAVALAVGQIEGWFEGALFFLQELCVLPDRRGQGIGGHLLSHFLSEIKHADRVLYTYLLTDSMSAAESFYTHRGFRRSDRKILLSIGQ